MTSMPVILPLIGYILLILAFRTYEVSWRTAALLAATIWGTLIVLITEILSLPHWLTKEAVSATWLVIDSITIICLWRIFRRSEWQSRVMGLRDLLRQMSLKQNGVSNGMIAGVAIVILLVGITALLSPPNTWDSMEYHLPRVVHWIQNRSVAFYPTNEIKQLYMPPWAEFAMLHLHLLSGGDGLANLVQWFSLLGSVVGVSLLAQSMGAGYQGQTLAAVVCATIPQGILQASGAKNDYVVAFWLVVLIYFLLRYRQKPTVVNALWIGGALGLAWMTKVTAYIFTLAIVMTWLLAYPWKAKMSLLKHSVLIIILVVGLNAGHFVRNFNLFGSPLGPMAASPSGAFKPTNDKITFSTLISNVIRNAALHVGTPSIRVNQAFERWAGKTIQAFGGDMNDHRTTWDFTTFHVPEMSKHESLAGNPAHLALILLTIIILVADWRIRRKFDDLTIYIVGLMLSYILFCMALKWQPWNTRLHLPLFVLWSVAIGVLLSRAWPNFVTTGFGIVLLLLSGPSLLENQLRPLVFSGEFNVFNLDRRAMYFTDHRDLMDSFIASAELMNKGQCKDIGLDIASNRYEYPMLVLLNGDKEVRQVGITATPAAHGGGEKGFNPCAIICPNCSKEKQDEYLSSGKKPVVYGDVTIFSEKVESAPQSVICTMTFSTGWHVIERSGQDWWRWSEGRGQVKLSILKDTNFTMQGEIISVERPNKVEVLLNGQKVTTWAITGNEFAFSPFKPVTVSLKAGENIIEFISQNAATKVPPDPRLLAIALRNLRLTSKGDESTCQLQR